MIKTSKKAYTTAIGRRKTAITTIRLSPNEKQSFIINNIPADKYFPQAMLQAIINQPLKIYAGTEKYSIQAKTVGGGSSSQAQSISLAIARALIKIDDKAKIKLKKVGLLSRDSRKKERKKPGLRRARRAPQWSKR